MIRRLAPFLLLSLCIACGGGTDGTPVAPPAVPAPNRGPTPVGTIPEQVLRLGDEPTTLNIAPYFSDPDGDTLSYGAISGDTQVATISVSGSTASITGQNPGEVEITISARDPSGATAMQSVSVTVEAAGFTLSGTVSDSRMNGPMLAGAVVRLGNDESKSVTTDADGRYRFSNVSGTVSVTATAAPSYVSQTVEVAIDADHTVDFALNHTGVPPFGGTALITPDILDAADPTSLGSVRYVGRGERSFWDRPAESWITVNAYLFDVAYAGFQLEYQVHPEFRTEEAARMEVDKYAPVLGRLPLVLLSGAREVEISVAAGAPALQGNASLGLFHIYTDNAESLIRDGFLEEVFLHEAGHVSLDAAHGKSAGWRAAQEADGVFISDYARDFPDGEDIAESILPYFAVRYRPERLTEADRSAILAAIPNRLVYFDAQRFEMSPYSATGSTARVFGLRPFQP